MPIDHIDHIAGALEVGTRNKEVVVNGIPEGTGHIVFSPAQALGLATSLMRQALLAEGEASPEEIDTLLLQDISIRELRSHHSNRINNAITIGVIEKPDEQQKNIPPHEYLCHLKKGDHQNEWPDHIRIRFHVGAGPVNGLTNEALLAILVDRFIKFQEGPFACEENAVALEHIVEAMTAVIMRTARRDSEGKEGTQTP